MRASPPRADTALIASHLDHAPGFADVLALSSTFHAADPELIGGVLEAAARFSDDVLAPLNDRMDREGVRLADGRIRTAPGHAEAWAQFIDGGWTTLDQPERYGGQGLPLALALAVQEIGDRACPAFGMLVVLQRAAARLIAAWGDEAACDQWLPGIVSGEIGATICISEPGAGSDVAQLRTRAVPDSDGTWRVTGEKCWISFGDHDLTERIVHCVLARTDAESAERPEIGLFLVEGGSAQGPAVQALRAEEKLGLHGSPTCVMAFDNARATLLGERGRGLAQMFVMLTQMRLAVGAMGLGIASGATDTAVAYALERRQGGKPGSPVPIVDHVDVRRQLTEMIARTELLRGLLLACANQADIAEHAEGADVRNAARALLQFLLPIVKTLGADAAFLNASTALQVLGGAGYTREWPVEQALRDARVLAVFEGTTGIQALDMVHRRVRGGAEGLARFMGEARALKDPDLDNSLDHLEAAAEHIRRNDADMADIEAGAVAFLDLATLAAMGWIAARIRRMGDDAPLRMRIAARYWLADIADRAAALDALVRAGANRLASIDELSAA